MRVIYPLKVVQIILTLVGAFLLLRGRQICHEKQGLDVFSEAANALNNSEGRQPPCQNVQFVSRDFNILPAPKEASARSRRSLEALKVLPKEKSTVEETQKILRGLDEDPTLQNLTTENVTKIAEVRTVVAMADKEPTTLKVAVEEADGVVAENATIEKKEEATTLALDKKDTIDHMELGVVLERNEETLGEEEKKSDVVVLNRSSGFSHVFYKKNSIKSMRKCVNLAWSEKLFASERDNVLWGILSTSGVIYLLLTVVFLLEILFFLCSDKEFSKMGSRIAGGGHLLLVMTAAWLLYAFRGNWNYSWVPLRKEGSPEYPCDWTCAEVLAWLLALVHLLEMVFYRAVNGSVVFVGRMDSYNVVDRELTYLSPFNDPSKEREYLSPYKEPQDGSDEL